LPSRFGARPHRCSKVRRLPRPVFALLRLGTALLLASCVTPIMPDLNATAPVLSNSGSLNQPVSTASPEAQRLFNRGVLQAYAFNEREAVRTFKASLAADPSCAMCAWGVAWALGPNINATDRGDQTDMRRYAALARPHMPRNSGIGHGSTPTYRYARRNDALIANFFSRTARQFLPSQGYVEE
jgi:hypothetical protein